MKPIKITDSRLFRVTLVVAIPNYHDDLPDAPETTAADWIMEALAHDPEITILNIDESRLAVTEVE